MIDPRFTNINRLYFLSFNIGRNLSTRNCFNKYYMPLVVTKDFNVLNDNKLLFKKLMLSKLEAYKKLLYMYHETMNIQC